MICDGFFCFRTSLIFDWQALVLKEKFRMPASFERPDKHVIILGAGASFTAGYPLATDLRRLLSSRDDFAEFARERIQNEVKWTELMKEWDRMHTSRDLFRHGGFATVDEFCWLVSKSRSKKFSRAVNDMRLMTAMLLSLHHPEREFHKVPYYQFVQRLFDSSLCGVRDDIVVLTFNYDVYLEHLMLRAYNKRCSIMEKGAEHDVRNAITGGFLDRGAWEQRGAEGNGFAILKLHGSICGVVSGEYSIGHEDVLVNDPASRVQRCANWGAYFGTPEIIFPWELFEDKAEFLDEQLFPDVGCNRPTPYRAFAATWKRAQAAITAADKVSFVGCSVHDYLAHGLRYLFANRRGHIRVVMADKANGSLELVKGRDRGITPAHKLCAMLQRVANVSSWRDHTDPPEGKEYDSLARVRCVPDFAEFIRTEMN